MPWRCAHCGHTVKILRDNPCRKCKPDIYDDEWEQVPLFIPLRREWFDKFKDGSKRVEYRPIGPKWNPNTCAIGRPVVLSLGYGKTHRLQGHITGFWSSSATTPEFQAIYGADRVAACIRIELQSHA